MRKMKDALLMVAMLVLSVPSLPVLGRPQGSLPIADLIPTKNIEIRPAKQISLFDLKSATINEVEGPPLPNLNANLNRDDAILPFPGSPSSSIGNEFSSGPPAPNLNFPAGPPASNFDFQSGPTASNFDFPAGPPTPNLDFPAGPPAPNFDFPAGPPFSSLDYPSGSTNSNFDSTSGALVPDFDLGGSPTSIDSYGQELPGLPSEFPGNNFKTNVQGPSPSPDFGSYIPTSGGPSDNVQFSFPDPSSGPNTPYLPNQDKPLLLNDKPGGVSIPGVDDSFTLETGPSPTPVLNIPTKDIPILENNPNQNNFGGIEPVEPHRAPVIPVVNGPVNHVPQRTIGNGNQRVPDNNNDELLSLLTLGFLDNRQSSTNVRGGSNGNSQSNDPLKGLFNLITLGLFEENQRGPDPLAQLVSTLSFGILGNGNQGGGGLDLSKIGFGPDAVADLAQIANSEIDALARETSQGVQLAQDEVQFLGREKLQQVFDNLRQTGRTFGDIGQNTYRGLLQKKSVLSRLLMGLVENFGSYINTSVGNTFQKVGDTANVLGKFINDLKVGLLNSIIAKGESVRELVSGTLGTVGTAVTDFTSAAQGVAEDNIRSITGIKALPKFR